MPKSLLSDYSAREITGEVLLYETRACFLAALGSHWTKSNKSTLLLSSVWRGVGVGVKRVDSKYQRVLDKEKFSRWSFVLISTTPPVYDVGFIGLLHPLSKIIWCKYNGTALKSPMCKYSTWHTRNWPSEKNSKVIMLAKQANKIIPRWKEGVWEIWKQRGEKQFSFPEMINPEQRLSRMTFFLNSVIYIIALSDK